MSDFLDNLLTTLTNFGLRLLVALAVFFVGFFLIKWITKLIGNCKKLDKLTPNVKNFLINIIKIVLWVVLAVIIAEIFGVSMTAISAILLSVGLALALAMHKTVANLIGGITILLSQTFKVGDFINDGTHSGTVTDMGVFYTTLTTAENTVITIPNNTLANASVVDYSANENCRLDLEIAVSYDSDIELVKKTLTDLANAHELVLKDPAPFVRLGKQGESALMFYFRVWVKAEDYQTVNFDLLEASKKLFDIRGIKMPYPQMDVHIDTVDKK